VNIPWQGAAAARAATRIEAMCVPQGWRALPPDPLTNRDEIPIVLKLRQIFAYYGNVCVDELWFLRVEHALASAMDALNRAKTANNALAGVIESDIQTLRSEIRRQRALCKG
jgi:hypothetical protein